MSAAPSYQSQPLTGRDHSVDIDLLGATKVCSFDCAYCDLGPTEVRLNKLKEKGVLPSVESILENARGLFKAIHEKGPMVDEITISGNGEATVHPDFPEIVNGLIELRNQWLPGRPIVLFTNGFALDQRRISEAANRLDRCFVKIDAGNERVFKMMAAPLSRVTLQKVLSGVRLLKNVSVQAMFCQGIVDNTQSADVEDWIEVIALLKPSSVLIQGVQRPPQDGGVHRCEEDTLYTIASKLERRTGIKAVVLP